MILKTAESEGKRVCGSTDNCIVFGSSSKSGLVGNAWDVYTECAKVMVYGCLGWGPIPGIRGQRIPKKYTTTSLIRVRSVMTMMVTSTGKNRGLCNRDICTLTKVDAIKVIKNQNGTSHVGLMSHS